MPRIARLIYPDYPHHVTHRGNNKQTVFGSNQDRHFYLHLLKKYTQESGCEINSYCLMPNHIHLLMVPAEKDSLAKSMQKISLSYTQYINKKYNRSGRLWECRFFSAIIDKESYLWEVIRYIEQNPLRAGIVDNPVEYKWSTARINFGLEKPVFTRPVWEKYISERESKQFLFQPMEKDKIRTIRKHTSRGLPIGSRKFSNQMVAEFGEIIINKKRGRPSAKS